MAGPDDDRGLLRELVGDGRPALALTAVALLFSGAFAILLATRREFLPHDVTFLGMTAGELCAIADCRIVRFMFHDRVAFGGTLLAVAILYLWLAFFPLRRGAAWAWWAGRRSVCEQHSVRNDGVAATAVGGRRAHAEVSRKVIETYPELPASWAPYDPQSPTVAMRVASLIRERVPRVTVEHIGSTAVPEFGGKGVVDVMIVCASEEREWVSEVLADLGFQPQSTRDPFPESRPMRVGALRHKRRLYRIHAHVLTSGNPEVRALLDFRDRLRADSMLRERYEACKKAILASGGIDSLDYSKAKEQFFADLGGAK